MKTISAQQAVQQFDEYSELAHNGEKILVTRSGKPWVLLSPPAAPDENKAANGKLKWPDFAARLAPHYPASVAGPTATELLAQDKEDRFGGRNSTADSCSNFTLAGSQHAGLGWLRG